ncbi:MAG: GTP-binding protein, partial [Patescibacteria group bacterium]|nr:GTP-binding protein [Patescibacteria group bacterium]
MTTKKQSTKKKVRRTRKPKEYRCPIVTFLGHVDHGKTTILDQIRKSSVQSGEFGGITQKISVYSVEHNGKDITFVDTPGHEAFDLMREQGGQISDIVLLIVAANDGVKPQTKESIKIIKTTKKPCIVVLNKIDLKTSDVSKVKRDLASEGIQVESAGGDIPCVEVSGKTGKGIDDLIEMILLVAEVSEVCKNKAPKEALGKATVLESIKDASKGNVSSIIVTAGEFRKTDFVCYKKEEVSVERIKGFAGENSKTLTKVVQGYGGQLIGTRDLITPGSVIYCVPSPSIDVCEELFKSKAVKKKSPKKKSSTKPGSVKSGKKDEEPESEDNLLSEMIGDIGEDSEKSEILDVVLRSSSQGAMEAVKKSIGKIDKKEELIRVVDTKVGDISLSDVEYARSVG